MPSYLDNLLLDLLDRATDDALVDLRHLHHLFDLDDVFHLLLDEHFFILDDGDLDHVLDHPLDGLDDWDFHDFFHDRLLGDLDDFVLEDLDFPGLMLHVDVLLDGFSRHRPRLGDIKNFEGRHAMSARTPRGEVGLVQQRIAQHLRGRRRMLSTAVLEKSFIRWSRTRRALEAVESMLAEVALETLDDVPGMQVVRRELLEDAARLYEQLLLERPSATAMRARLAQVQLALGDARIKLGEMSTAEEASCNGDVALANCVADAGAADDLGARLEGVYLLDRSADPGSEVIHCAGPLAAETKVPTEHKSGGANSVYQNFLGEPLGALTAEITGKGLDDDLVDPHFAEADDLVGKTLDPGNIVVGPDNKKKNREKKKIAKYPDYVVE